MSTHASAFIIDDDDAEIEMSGEKNGCKLISCREEEKIAAEYKSYI